MKRVALELQPCCGQRSGIGLYAYELARRLKDTEEISFFGQVHNFLSRNKNDASLAGIKIPIKESRLMPYGVYRRIWGALPFSYETITGSHADLSVFFNYIVPPKVSGKVIDTVCDMTYLRFPETMNKSNLKRISDGICRSVERSARLITISEFSKREISELLKYPLEQISVVPCGPSLTKTAADFELVRKKYKITRPYILYVGTIEPRKNLERMIQAFSMLKCEEGIEHQLVLAGGKGWNNEAIFAAAERSDFRDDICFTGYISEEEKNALYKHAAMLAFPSLYEGFGMPPLEAMAWDCPVLCSDVASLPEVAGDAACLVDPLDTTDIAAGLWKILSDDSFRSNIVRKGHQRLSQFTWETSAAKFIRVCEEVLG